MSIWLWFHCQFFKLRGLRGKITLPWTYKWQLLVDRTLVSVTDTFYKSENVDLCSLECCSSHTASCEKNTPKNIFPNCKITFEKTTNLQVSGRFSWSKQFFKDIPERPVDCLSWYHHLLTISSLILHIFPHIVIC